MAISRPAAAQAPQSPVAFRLRRTPLHGKTRAPARAPLSFLRKVLLECRNVFLARLHVPRKSAPLSPGHPRRARGARENDRHAQVRRNRSPHLSQARKYFRGFRHHGTSHARRPHASVFVLPAKVGWSDIGSWQAVFELLAAQPGANVSASPHFALDATGNYLWSPKKFIAAIGVNDLVVVETDDAILICPRDRSQDVGKIVKHLEHQKRKNLV